MDPHHERLVQDAIAFLESQNFLVPPAPTYHTICSVETKKRFQNVYTPTSLYFRGRADRSAIHRTLPLVFEWEAKTNGDGRWPNMAIELLPLLHHINKGRLGVRCLYLYRDERRGYDKGFWTNKLPPIDIVLIPDRWSDAQTNWYKRKAEEFFPDVKIRTKVRIGGSRDPLVLVLERDVQDLRSWQDLIIDEVQKVEKWMQDMPRAGQEPFWEG